MIKVTITLKMYIKNLIIFKCSFFFKFVSGGKYVNRVHSGSMDATHQASRWFSSVMRPGSSALELLAVSIKGVTGSEGIFAINCFLKNSTS